MGESFKDFPCLYYVDGCHVERKNQVYLFSMLSSMFGKTPEETISNSELFAHTAGILGGVAITQEEVAALNNVFNKPYKDCRNFARRKVFADIKMKENCCFACPYSHSYANDRITIEREVLHGCITHREWIDGFKCSKEDFSSFLPVSCGNSITPRLPIIPFNSYLFDYLVCDGGDLDAEHIAEYISPYLLASGLFVDHAALVSFINVQLKTISGCPDLTEDATFFRVSDLRTGRGTYVPPQFVQPTSVSRSSALKRNKQLSDDIDCMNRLFRTAETMQYVEAQSSIVAAPSSTKPDVSAGGIDESSEVLALWGLNDGSAADFNTSVSREPACSDVVDESESSVEPFLLASKTDSAEVECNDLVSSPAPANDATDADCEPEPSVDEATDTCMDSSTEEVLETIDDGYMPYPAEAMTDETAASYLDVDEDDIPYLTAQEVSSVFDLVDSEDESDTEKPSEESAPALPSYPVLSSEFCSLVVDCSGGDTENLFSFLSKAAGASAICIERVIFQHTDGLLFYVTGTYFFVAVGTSSNKILKPIFSSGNVTFYSVNTIPVHAALIRCDIRRAKIESVMVHHSYSNETEKLYHIDKVFRVADGIDLYRSIMPQYVECFSRDRLPDTYRAMYQNALKLEWALSHSFDISMIALGNNQSVIGNNAIDYKMIFSGCDKFCRQGSLFLVSLEPDCKVAPEKERRFWEDVAGRLAASSAGCLDYAFLIALGEGIGYYSCYEEEIFFDSLMASTRSAYRKRFKKEVSVSVVKENYR